MTADAGVTSRTTRYGALDGLRGIAALVVVIGHIMLAFPRLAVVAQSNVSADGWAWWFADTPLRVLWNGYASVLIFFVLSGFVLTVNRRNSTREWLAYYPSRLIRLYLPVWGAVLACFVLAHAAYDWSPTSRGGVVGDLVLVRGTDGLDLPIWSLQWEMLFSLLLPLYIIFVRVRPSLWPWKLAVVLAVVATGLHTGHQTLIYLPMFALGAVIAVAYERLPDTTLQGPLAVALLVTVTLVALDARSIAATAASSGHAVGVVAELVEVVGAALTVVCALSVPRIRALLLTPAGQWLGSRSFSIYLMHWPVVALVAHAVGTGAARAAVVAALPLALLVAEVFYRAVESPAHQLSRRASIALRSRPLGARLVPTS